MAESIGFKTQKPVISSTVTTATTATTSEPKLEGSVFGENEPMQLPGMPLFDYGSTATRGNQVPFAVTADKSGSTSAQYACDGHDTLTEISNASKEVAKATVEAAKATVEAAKKIPEVVVDSAKSAATFISDMGEYYSEQYEGVSSYGEFVERTDAMLYEGFQIIDDHTVNPWYEKAKQTCKDNGWTTAEACVELAQETINSKSITTGAIVTAATITGVSAVAAAVPTVAAYGIGLATAAGMVYGGKNTAEGVADALDAKTEEEYKAGVKKALSGEVMAILSTYGLTQIQEASAIANNLFMNDKPCVLPQKPSINEPSAKPVSITLPKLAQAQLETTLGAAIKPVIIPAQLEVLSAEQVETLTAAGQQILATASPALVGAIAATASHALVGATAVTAVANPEPEKPIDEEQPKKTDDCTTQKTNKSQNTQKKEVINRSNNGKIKSKETFEYGEIDGKIVKYSSEDIARGTSSNYDYKKGVYEINGARFKDPQTGKIYTKKLEYKVQIIEPENIHFSQQSVNENYADIVASFKENGWQGKPVDLIKTHDGHYISMDNRRILAAREAGIQVHAVIHDVNEPLSCGRRIQCCISSPITSERVGAASTWGEAIYNRLYENGLLNTDGSIAYQRAIQPATTMPDSLLLQRKEDLFQLYKNGKIPYNNQYL